MVSPKVIKRIKGRQFDFLNIKKKKRFFSTSIGPSQVEGSSMCVELSTCQDTNLIDVFKKVEIGI